MNLGPGNRIFLNHLDLDIWDIKQAFFFELDSFITLVDGSKINLSKYVFVYFTKTLSCGHSKMVIPPLFT